MIDSELNAEATAFNQRIEERINAGFIPDLRRSVKCEYFYKSFWRDPHFIKLILGERVDVFMDMLHKYSYKGAKILDVGCGPGYISLELARAGYHVVGIDIAEKAIEVARKTLESNYFKDGFGSLEYQVIPFEKANGIYDVIFFQALFIILIIQTTLLAMRSNFYSRTDYCYALNLVTKNGA